MIFVSYYTANGNYPKLAEKLKESLKKFGLKFRVHQFDNGGQPIPHHIKADYILQMLTTLRRPVVWLDADCEVIQLPNLFFQNDYDFMVYNWHNDADNKLGVVHDPNQLLCSGGVQYWGYTAPALELCMRWRYRLEQDQRPDDIVLDSVFNQHRPPVKPLWLPKSYNRMAFHWPDEQPVINHDYQDGEHAKAIVTP